MTTFSELITETFNVVSCYTCAARFAVTSVLYRRAVTDAQGSLYCPACGSQTCWRESDDQKRIKELQKKLEWEAAEVARQKTARENAELNLKETNMSLIATRGVVTRMKCRTNAGVCQCCNRTFKQLARHMATKHPGLKTEHPE